MSPSPPASGAGSRAGSPRLGLKQQLEQMSASHATLARTVATHATELQALRDHRDAAARAAEDAVRAAVKELRTEWFAKLGALVGRIEGLEREVATQRGEANVLSQQNKDAARRIAELTDHVRELAVEVSGAPLPEE